MIPIKVLFLGPARDFAGEESAILDLPDGATVADLRKALSDRYSRLTPALPSIRFAVNQEFADDDTVLTAADEVALIPPVSGGGEDQSGILVDLVHGPIPAGRVRDFVMGDPAHGAIVTFEGATRRERDAAHAPLAHLDYEAYAEMAVRRLTRIAREAKERWSAGRVAVVHRFGPVPVGEVSVMIAVATGHREAGFTACRWIIDTIKKDVPIWKKEVFEDGHTRWVNPTTD